MAVISHHFLKMPAYRKAGRKGAMRIPDELLDHLGDLYQKYPFKMTFAQFVDRVIARMEKRCRNWSRAKSKKENGSWMNKGFNPYDPSRRTRS
jgi:hypothetical protein